MVYDVSTATVVLYSRSNDGQTSETWIWNGVTWTLQHPLVKPPPRDAGALGYDPASHQVLLFGGQSLMDPMHPYLADTWTWDGSNWAQQKPKSHPDAVGLATLSDDAAAGLVLFGGFGVGSTSKAAAKPPGLYPASTWLWDGAGWNRATD